MVQDIIVIVFCVVAFGAAIWGWWIDSGMERRVIKRIMKRIVKMKQSVK
jgi:hypothetical protein